MKVKADFYKILPASSRKFGVLHAPKGRFPIAWDGEEVKDWQSLVVELKGGIYCDFHECTGEAHMVNDKLKSVLETFLTADSCVEFLPVRAISAEYGDRQYYIMHFTKRYDVVDMENSIYVEAAGHRSIAIERIDREKAKGQDLKIFNTNLYMNEIIISNEVYTAIKKAKADTGIEFYPIYYGTD